MRFIALPSQKFLTIRHLNQSHLPLLKGIKKNCKKLIEENYKVPVDKLRVYLNYLPSFYYLHVFFTHFSAVRAGIFIQLT